jgi:hypothetical protein
MTEEIAGARCVLCRMHTPHRWLRLPLCAICRDQSYDFLWASGVQGVIALAGGLSGGYLVLEEVLLFAVLVLVKHRIPPPWGREH